MKYLGGKFSVYPGSSEAYRDNYDRVFGDPWCSCEYRHEFEGRCVACSRKVRCSTCGDSRTDDAHRTAFKCGFLCPRDAPPGTIK